jgi:predicted DNA-binding protein (UPF0251 family)
MSLAAAVSTDRRVEPIALRKSETAASMGIHYRTLEKLIKSGRFPKADAWIGSAPLWLRETVEKFVRDGGAPLV